MAEILTKNYKMALGYIILAVIIVSLISFVGILTLMFRRIESSEPILISFAVGTMLAVAFLDLIPESIAEINVRIVFYLVLGGFFFFFLLEKFFHWRHCHEEICREHPFSYLSLLGDGVHNFFDGMIISASFLTNFSLGFATTIAVIAHEIPQEFSDFAVLIHGGFTKKKAILWNFLISLTALFGALLVYFIPFNIELLNFMLPVAAGGFIYIAASDLIPEIHKEKTSSSSIIQILFFLAGIAIISFLINALG